MLIIGWPYTVVKRVGSPVGLGSLVSPSAEVTSMSTVALPDRRISGIAAESIASIADRPFGQSVSPVPACGDSFSDTLDFFSLNAYEWCGDSSYETSGYSQLDKNATGYPIPIFFSETGCNVVEPRTFGDQAAILGPEMSDLCKYCC